MENFYLRLRQSFDVEDSPNDLKSVEYKYENVYLNEKNILIAQNKHTKNEREIGLFNSTVIKISKSLDEQHTVIVTKEDFILFDRYFDMINEISTKKICEIGEFIDIIWGREEFAILYESKIEFYDLKLNLLGSNSSHTFRSAVFRQKYHIFVVSTADNIVFIESNGQEHGDPINLQTQYLSLSNNEDLLICVEELEGPLCVIEILYSKNFYWYKKQKLTLKGRFHKFIDTGLQIKDGDQVKEYMTSCTINSLDNKFYVIDGNNLLFTDLASTKIPPPLYGSKINFKSQIRYVDVQKDHIGVIVNDNFIVLSKELKIKNVFTCSFCITNIVCDFCCVLGENIFGFYEGRPYVWKSGCWQMLSIGQLCSYVWKGNVIYQVSEMYNISEYNPKDSDRIIDMKIAGETPYITLTDGGVIIKGVLFKIARDLCKSETYVKELDGSIFMVILEEFQTTYIVITNLSDGVSVISNFKAQLSGQDIQDIYKGEVNGFNIEIFVTDALDSIYYDNRAIIYIKDGYMSIVTDTDCQSIFSDPKFKILGCTNLEIFGQTRHGTLETLYPKSFTNIVVSEYIDKKDYVSAFTSCNNDFALFLKKSLDLKLLLTSSNTFLLSLFSEICKKFGDFEIILHNEELKQIQFLLDPDSFCESFTPVTFDPKVFINLRNPSLCEALNIKSYPLDRTTQRFVETVDNCISHETKVSFLNEVFEHLDLIRNFEVILYILVKFRRVDLAIKLARSDLLKGIKYIMTLTTMDEIKKAVVVSFDNNLIIEVYKIIQQDSSSIVSFIDSNDSSRFKICNLIENRPLALYWLACETFADITDITKFKELENYVIKYKLSQEVLVLANLKEFEKPKNVLIELYADTCHNHLKAIKIYKFLNLNRKLIDLYIEKNMFREAVDAFNGDTSEIYPQIIKNLERTGMFYELGCFYEEIAFENLQAIENYLKAKRLGDVLRIVKKASFDSRIEGECKPKILSECMSIMRTQSQILENTFARYKKYRDRLLSINNRGDDVFNDETSFSYSTISDKTRGRPGGIYEKEFLLEKLASLGEKIVKWRDDVEDLINLLRYYDENNRVTTFLAQFERVIDVLRLEYYELFKDKNYERYDNKKAPISPTDMSKYF